MPYLIYPSSFHLDDQKTKEGCVITVKLLEGGDLLASDVETGKSDPVCFLWVGHQDEVPSIGSLFFLFHLKVSSRYASFYLFSFLKNEFIFLHRWSEGRIQTIKCQKWNSWSNLERRILFQNRFFRANRYHFKFYPLHISFFFKI